MPFVKLVKNKAYYKRYQVKYRRRREGKTDYYARKRLVAQAKNKYNSPKFRLVVRCTNTDIIAQIVHSKLQGDIVIASAYAHELKNFGIKAGLKNWAASYATGLLVARRVLAKLGLDKKFPGTEANGEFFEVETIEDGPRPFKAFLDIGLHRTTTGAKIFGALKGAADGGIYVPHSESRFPGYDKESSELDAETLRKYIFAGHVADYMRDLKEEDEESYKRQFSQFIKNKISADDLEPMYKKAHAAIRANPNTGKKERKPLTKEQKAKYASYHTKGLNYKQRKDRVKQKIANFRQKLASGIAA